MAVYPDLNRQNTLADTLCALKNVFERNLYMGLVRIYGAADERDMAAIERIALSHQIPLLALGDVLYHKPERRPLQDVLTCIREGKTLHRIGTKLEINAERYLRSPQEMSCLFQRLCPSGSEEEIAQQLNFSWMN